jgi:hypothetical protein
LGKKIELKGKSSPHLNFQLKKFKFSLNRIVGAFSGFTFILTIIFLLTPDSFKDSALQKTGLQANFSTNYNESAFQFKFLELAANQVPFYFKGCGPIDYYVRQNYATNEDLEVLDYAFNKMSVGIGRQFIFKGFVSLESGTNALDGVFVNFTDESISPSLRESIAKYGTEVAANGGPDISIGVNRPKFGSFAATKGTVNVNKRYWIETSYVDKATVIMHEVGHVLGLTHPLYSAGQVMGSGIYEGAELGAGDKLGLEILSAVAGCRPFPQYLQRK